LSFSKIHLPHRGIQIALFFLPRTLIFLDKSYVSFGNMGLMDQLAQSTKYVPAYELVEKIRSESLAIGEKNKAVEIAKELKRMDMDIEVIARLTKLSIEEINALRVRKHK
jgi:DNA repair protein RadC